MHVRRCIPSLAVALVGLLVGVLGCATGGQPAAKGDSGAAEMTRDELLRAARGAYSEAGKLRDEAQATQKEQLKQQAIETYERAGRAWERLIEAYPDDEQVPKWTLLRGESHYYALQYMEAYRQYRAVREMEGATDERRVHAAHSALKALENQIRASADDGDIAFGFSEDGALEPIGLGADDESGPQKVDMPDVVRTYLEAMERYVELGPPEDGEFPHVATIAFRAGRNYFNLGHFEAAREQFQWVVDNYEERDEARGAANLILESFRKEKDYDKMAEWAGKLEGVFPEPKVGVGGGRGCILKVNEVLHEAGKYFRDEEYKKAAERYLQYADAKPEADNAPRALNNAAVSYEKLGQYSIAVKIYERIYRKYPDSDAAVQALYRRGVNAERVFEYEKALELYLRFVDEYEGVDEKLVFGPVEELHADALLNAAILSQNFRRYAQAAELYEKFVDARRAHEDAEQAQWRAVVFWKKAGETENMREAFAIYRQNYGLEVGYPFRLLAEGVVGVARAYEPGATRRSAGLKKAVQESVVTGRAFGGSVDQ